ncbi:MAG: bifunctional 5,10-methylenetetrahydrofolate dehydrogenase/5,10-methenyltetrahydrofolate cyclohydrolase, partial [Dictyoglomaceae bacterium]|nr:bifunctional 5,10-methylenetetrahydrofolate dehydrogenase/5,10-methenyltetrahydrofolate cyclohydrolase [Dictyoglomaceae bacterium]
KLVGDVDFERVKEKVKAITPVPGGVGVITVRVLAKNLLEAVRKNETGN